LTAIGIVIAAIVAVGGWFVVNALAARRERENDRRDYRTRFLIDAWVAIEDAANRSDEQRLLALEDPIARIQLLGTPHQIELAQTFTRAMAEKSRSSLDELLIDLRRDLREELELEPVSDRMLHLRVKPKQGFRGALSSALAILLAVAEGFRDRPIGAPGKPPDPLDRSGPPDAHRGLDN
jgi:hypothetical protein